MKSSYTKVIIKVVRICRVSGRKNKLQDLISEAVKIDLAYGLPDAKALSKIMTPSTTIPVSIDDLPIVSPPEQFTTQESLDLLNTLEQMNTPVTSRKLLNVYDKHPQKLFKTFVESKGRSYNEDYYLSISNDLVPLILKLKYFYNRPRPFQVAKMYGLNLVPLDTDTTATPAYPSGHTIQAYVTAILLSHQFPDLANDLLGIAELISQSRIDCGVHFKSDIIYGRMLASLISKRILDENFA